MKKRLPDLSAEIDDLFKRFREETRNAANKAPSPLESIDEKVVSTTSGETEADGHAQENAEADADAAIQPGVDERPPAVTTWP